jgi:phage terminase Nu1 subunit (DNA packaging protein)
MRLIWILCVSYLFSSSVYAKHTWVASGIALYDSRGNLWRFSETHNIQLYDVETPWMVAETLYDQTVWSLSCNGLFKRRAFIYEVG